MRNRCVVPDLDCAHWVVEINGQCHIGIGTRASGSARRSRAARCPGDSRRAGTSGNASGAGSSRWTYGSRGTDTARATCERDQGSACDRCDRAVDDPAALRADDVRLTCNEVDGETDDLAVEAICAIVDEDVLTDDISGVRHD